MKIHPVEEDNLAVGYFFGRFLVAIQKDKFNGFFSATGVHVPVNI